MSGDMTRGSPYKHIFKFFVPILLGNLFQQLYNMLDTLIVGRFISADAMTGVGSTGSITFFVMGLVWGLTAGFSVITSNFYGAGNVEGVRRSIANSIVLCGVMTVVLTAIAVPLSGPLLDLMQTPDAYYEYAYWYLVVVFAGIGATILYNIMSGLLRAVGNSKMPLYFLVFGTVLNILLDLLFIIVFGMEKTGAGWATVISQIIAGALCYFYLYVKYPELRPRGSEWMPRTEMVKRLMSVGLPMALQYSITAVGCMFRQGALNSMNAMHPGIVTAYTASSKAETLLTTPFNSLGGTMSTFAGQNYGAGKFDRIKRGVHIGMLYSLIFWAICSIICIFCFDGMMYMFIDRSTGDALLYFDDMLKYAREFMFAICLLYPLLAAVFIYRNTLQAIGSSSAAMIGGVLELIGRTLMSFVFVGALGYASLVYAEPVAWLAADMFLVPLFYVTINKLMRADKKVVTTFD